MSTSPYLRTLLVLTVCTLQACSSDTSDSSAKYTEQVAQAHAGDTPRSNVTPVSDVNSLSTSQVDYATIDGKTISGYLARPADAPANIPGILLIHEWWGLNDNIKRTAEILAAEGYAALAVDLYGGRTAENADSAKQLMQEAMAHGAASEENLRQAYGYLNRQGSARVGVIGWCFGGGVALRTALNMAEKINALAIYYGPLVLDRKALASLRMPVLGIFAAQDQTIPVKDVNQFASTLKALNKDLDIRIYPDVEHAFANPSGEHYAPKPAADAWEATLTFFNRALHQP